MGTTLHQLSWDSKATRHDAVHITSLCTIGSRYCCTLAKLAPWAAGPRKTLTCFDCIIVRLIKNCPVESPVCSVSSMETKGIYVSCISGNFHITDAKYFFPSVMRSHSRGGLNALGAPSALINIALFGAISSSPLLPCLNVFIF